MASSSSISVFDNYRFKSAFNEELYNSIVKNKKHQNKKLGVEEMEEARGHTFRSYVRGKVVDFSPENLRNVMRFRAHVQGAATDFETRKEHDQQLDQVLVDLCIPGATWKLSTGQLRVPIQLRRQELNPVARGWHEFSIHSLIPSSNRSKIPVIRVILIHYIMREKPITAKRMESTRLPRPVQRRQQENEEEDEPMPQAEEGNEEGNEGQTHDYDYHHQPEYEHHQPNYEQLQPDFEHHQEFNDPPVQPPLYHVPTYTDQHQKDLASIEEQLQNMMWY
ncbi:hypothetical protein PIB30_102165 [Stylosanthes scabra]|uniref:Putative plant transposon protein domain-containing protein n=1 Tax=Stylosanthes scabra TaxID=79078 RepID=A0ABU6V064_9FABA|nr:hypothetical protein [Stylosanthes scabra]